MDIYDQRQRALLKAFTEPGEGEINEDCPSVTEVNTSPLFPELVKADVQYTEILAQGVVGHKGKIIWTDEQRLTMNELRTQIDKLQRQIRGW
jgi:hypothetical protein